MKDQKLKDLELIQKANKNMGLALPSNLYNSFRLDIKRVITDVDGNELDVAVLPEYMKVNYPVYLFNKFDKDGGYYTGLRNLPLSLNLYNVYNATVNTYQDIVRFSGFANVYDKITIGDNVILFTNDLKHPLYFVWIIISSELRSYGSILNNPLDGGMRLLNMKYFSDFDAQYQQGLMYIVCDEIGNYNLDKLAPFEFKSIDHVQDDFLIIPKKFNINRYSGIYFYMDFRTNVISIIFNYEK